MTDDHRPLRDTRRGDRWAAVAYLLAAFFVTKGLWGDPAGVTLTENRQDHVQFEWVLANAARTVAHLSDPFFTDLMNHPAGVNLMANTSVWALALPLAPITALFGAPVAFCVLVTGAFFGTAFAWYFVLSRFVLRSRVAAFAGGALAGFLPGMVGQGTGHPNIVAQFMVPFIVAIVLGMREPGHVVRNGLLLAAAVTYQFFVNEEVLLLTALALGIFVVAYWIQRPAVIRRALPDALRSLAVTAVVVAALVAYPLYRQFRGPQAYHGLPDWVLEYNTDVMSYVSYAEQSLAGSKAGAEKLAQGVAEQNTFYGWGLLVLVVFTVYWLRRSAAVKALAAVGLVFAVLSFGRTLTVGGEKTQVAGPWAAVSHLPLLDTVVPTRLSLVTIPVVALLVALFVERIMADRGEVRLVGAVALAVALLPIVPIPLAVQDRRPTPEFFASGEWRRYVPAGGTIGLLPFAWDSSLDMMQYQTGQHLDFAILNGYFLGPDPGSPERRAAFGAGWSAPRDVLGDQRRSTFTVTDDDRADVLRDLRAWHTDALVLPDGAPQEAVVRNTADQILGPGEHVDDVTIWKVP
jgi:hypothetical protein